MLPLHRSACGTGRHRSHGFGIPGTDLTPVAFNLPAGHRFSTGAELMLFFKKVNSKSLSGIVIAKSFYPSIHAGNKMHVCLNVALMALESYG